MNPPLPLCQKGIPIRTTNALAADCSSDYRLSHLGVNPDWISAPRDFASGAPGPVASDFRLESYLSLDLPVVPIIAYRDGIEADRSYELPGFNVALNR